jgi:hypothetical protein
MSWFTFDHRLLKSENLLTENVFAFGAQFVKDDTRTTGRPGGRSRYTLADLPFVIRDKKREKIATKRPLAGKYYGRREPTPLFVNPLVLKANQHTDVD